MGAYTLTLSEIAELHGITSHISDDGYRIVDNPGFFGLANYDLHTSVSREELNGLIFDTYWNREIAHETVDIFRMRMRTQMHLIMPPMNELLASVALEYDPLTTMDMTTTGSNTSESSSAGDAQADTSSDNTAESRSVSSDTPQSMLAMNKDYAGSAVDARNAGVATSTSSEERSSQDTASGASESRTVGYAGSPASLILAHRETIINVRQAIIDELDPLFLQLWSSPHSFTQNRTFI